jgi:hypothetical protein
MRACHGQRLAGIVASATGKRVALEDFQPGREHPIPLDWPTEIAHFPRARAALHRARRRARVAGRHAGEPRQDRWRHRVPRQTASSASADLQDIAPTSLLEAAEASEDSVLFYLDDPQGVLLVDCYSCPPAHPFSVAVRGEALIRRLQHCFE